MSDNCTTGCFTRDHATYGECLRAKTVKVAYCNSANGSDYTTQKNWDKNIDLYASARAQGVQPKSTRTSDIRAALDRSDVTGSAFTAS